MGPLVITKPGTIEDPTLDPAYVRGDSEKAMGARSLFLVLFFRQQHHERIVDCTGFPTDSHDNIWMEGEDNKVHRRCIECGHGYVSHKSARAWLTFRRVVYKVEYLGGAEEHGHG